MKLFANRDDPRNRRAFTFIEVMVATAITLVMFITFYTAMGSGIATIQVARENLRATQIMVGRMEGIRLFNWSQLTNTNLMPASFTTTYYPSGLNMNGTNINQGITYTGTVTVAAANLPTSYSSNMYQVTIQLQWSSLGVPHTRTMTTYCAQYGVQNYVWSNAN